MRKTQLLLNEMRTISVVVPVYNEEDNIDIIYDRVFRAVDSIQSRYNAKLLFIDNNSGDKTKDKIQAIAGKDKRVQAIFNAKNFGFVRSSFYGLIQATGDAVIMLYADLQAPPELIPELVRQWENGFKIVIGVKNKSKENPIMHCFRKMYYKLIKKISDVEQIEHYDGFGLYDRSFIEVLKQLDDPIPYLRGIVSELGYKRTEVFYEQKEREFGKSKWNFFQLYDFAFLGITSYSKVLLRLATFVGFFVAFCSIIVAIITFIQKIINWDDYPAGNTAIIVGIFFLGAVQLIFIGIMGEYIMNINTRILKRPLVIEEKRINMDEEV